MSLKLKLLEKIKSEKRLWHKGELADYARDLGYSSENAGRRLRELENEGLIKNKLNKKNCVMYYIEDSYTAPAEKPEPLKIEFGNKRTIHEMRWKK
jgi:CTP-dependent riboflavin kinase